MDPITLAIVAALAPLAKEAVKDAYDALKAALQQKFGISSKLLASVDALEEEPDSKGQQIVLQEQVAKVKADQDPDLLRLAESLVERIKELPGGTVMINQHHIDIKGDRNIVSGQGDVTVNE